MTSRDPRATPDAAPQGAELKLACPETGEAIDRKTAERLARLEADKELVLRLGLQGYVGPEWNEFITVLAQYAWQVFRGWLRSGKVYVECRHSGPRRRFDRQDDADEVAFDTIAAAIKAFREDVLIPMKWDASKGASLRTFFIGQCKLQFANVYRRWLSETKRLRIDETAIAAELEHQLAPWPSAPVALDFKRALPALRGDTVERIKGMTAMGYTNAEIAKLVETTEGAVNAKLYRARKKLKP